MKPTIVLTSFVMFFPTRALAADEFEQARATGLFAEAQALAEAGKHEAACAKFEESVEIHANVDNQFHLAECWEQVGRTASAYAAFLEVVEKARELGQSEREKTASERAHALSMTLTRLRVEVRTPAKDLELTRNGKAIAKADWGKPIPVDPGDVELRAQAPGKKTWLEKFALPSEPGTILIMVPPLEDENVRASLAAEKDASQGDPGVENESSDGLRTYATIGLLGIGATGVVVGSIMGARYATKNGEAKDICPSSIGCTKEEIALHEELVDDARTDRTWTYLGFAVGTAALAGAAVLHFTRPSSETRSDAPWLRARIVVTGNGVSGALQGGF